MGNSTFDVAWKLHVGGFHIIPSGGGESGKVPIVDWAEYQTRQPTDAEMTDWNETLSPKLWGLTTNSTLAVIDADTIEAREELIEELDDPHVITPRQGGHWYIDTTGHALPTKAGILPGVDIRGEGGFVNVCGRSTVGEYTILTLPSLDNLIPYERIPGRILDALNGHKRRPDPAEPILDGQRNATLASVAGSWRRDGLEETEIVEGLLRINAKRCQPPLPDSEVLTIASSISRYPTTNTGNNYYSNMPVAPDNGYETGQVRDNFGTTSGGKWGEFARRFDDAMSETPGPKDKREVAGTIGVQVTSDTFRKILRRRINEGKVRVYRRSPYLIEWINRDYTITDLGKARVQSYLPLKFPLYLEARIRLAPGNVVAIAGYTSSGKTSWLLEFAELNVFAQTLPIYYWYNEMSEAKLALRCEDFPMLIEAQRAGKFFPVKQGGFEFADVLEPNGINLIDYLDRNDNLFLIGDDIEQLQAKLEGGMLMFALQKRHNQQLGYGGIMSIKRSDLYIALDRRYEGPNAMHGIAEIVKAKEWADDRNPVHEICYYHTGGKHGKLYTEGDWQKKERGND